MRELASALAERNRKGIHSEMIRRLRLANLRKLLRDRNGPILPDDDAGREYLIELLLPISVGPHADIKMPNAIEVWAPWMQKDEATQLIDHINRMPIWERKPTAKTLGQRLNLTNPDRERLKLWTIAPSDMGERGMAWWRKHKDKQRKHRLRQLSGAKSQATSISRKKPWADFGIKRSTWYSQHRWTTSSEVKLTSSKDETVQAEKRKDASKRRFDVVMAWAIDRLGRSLIDLLSTIQTLEACGADLYLDQQSIDTTTPAGKLMFQVTGAFGEFERSMIRQRVHAGLKRAAQEGRYPGRPRISNAMEKRIQTQLRAGKGILKVAREVGVGTGTVQRIARELGPFDAAAAA